MQGEAADYESYSTYRPDVALHMLGRGGALMLGDLKIVDPIGSDPERVALPGAAVGFGNSLPDVKERMFGLQAHGVHGVQWNPRTGEGRVEAKAGDYTAALANNCEVHTFFSKRSAAALDPAPSSSSSGRRPRLRTSSPPTSTTRLPGRRVRGSPSRPSSFLLPCSVRRCGSWQGR